MLPTPLSHWVFITDGSDRSRLTTGSIDSDYPFPCSPGIVGSSKASRDQSGPQCSYPCPKGYYCPLATSEPKPCTLGSYCLTGSAAPLNCMAGTMGTRQRLTSAAECEICPPGSSCASGSSSALPCPLGSHAPNASSAACTPCPLGSHQDEEGQMWCKVCPQGWRLCIRSMQIPRLCPHSKGSQICAKYFDAVHSCSTPSSQVTSVPRTPAIPTRALVARGATKSSCQIASSATNA